MTRINLRVDKKHKTVLESIARGQGMTLADYMRYKLIDQNPDLAEAEDIYHCPSGEHYNYVVACISMFNSLLLDSLVKKTHGQEEGARIFSKAIADTKTKLEKIYGYKKVKDKDNE